MALTIGDLANEAGVGVETIRFYERKGLIERPQRPDSGFRRYEQSTARRVRFIRHTQELGFSLREIRGLLELRVNPDMTCADVKATALAKVAEVETRLEGLARIRDALVVITESCAGQGPTSACPILDTLDRRAERRRE